MNSSKSIPQRPYLLTPSHQGLELQRMNLEGTETLTIPSNSASLCQIILSEHKHTWILGDMGSRAEAFARA